MKRIFALLAALAFAPAAYAADLGGNCCADLEERIAELEATTARKGNRKVSLTVFGQVNAGILWSDVEASGHRSISIRDSAGVEVAGAKFGEWKGSGDDKSVFDNTVSESRVGFRGEAKISDDVSAGFLLEIGVGEAVNGSGDMAVRHAAWFLQSARVGRITVGQTSTATDDIDSISTANIGAAVKLLSAQPASGYYLGGDLPFDGGRTQVVRYDTPVVLGFVASAAWIGGETDFDAALRYAGEFSQFKLAAGAGFRRVEAVDDDIKTWLVNASVMHVPTGLFLNGAYGNLETSEAGGGFALVVPNYDITLKGWHALGGIEVKLASLGKTTFFAEYASLEGDRDRSYGNCFGSALVTCATDGDADLKWYGAGIVQAIDAAAMDIYLTARQYDLSMSEDRSLSIDSVGSIHLGEKAEADAIVVQGGARIRF
jgi:predicted porin